MMGMPQFFGLQFVGPQFLGAYSGAFIPVLLGLLLVVGLLGVVAWEPLRRENRLRRQLEEVRDLYAPIAGTAAGAGPVSRVARAVAGVGYLLTRSGILSPKAIVNLESTLTSAKLRGRHALPIFVGAKVLLMIGVPLLTWVALSGTDLSSTSMRLVLAAQAVAGLMAPDYLLRGIRKRYVASVERAMPDALDLLVICAEAGLALEQGMERVANEIRDSSPACSAELAITHNELRILADRRTALINMGQRTGLVSLQRLAAALAQSLRYGTPVGQALRVLAAEMRGEALTRFEARAARLPVLMTLPMILFILPCVFLIVAGPATLDVLDLLSR